MERKATIDEAKELFGTNFIGIDELNSISNSINLSIPVFNPELPFFISELKNKSNDYILVLAVKNFNDGRFISLRTLRETFGIDPETFEPCFYNQDWYINEKFVDVSLDIKWLLVKKHLAEDSRGKNPESLNPNRFFKAVEYTFVFFIYKLVNNQFLWENDFIWCSDKDSNDDRIYVGRYFDPIGVAKNGFSIHRHLKISTNYGVL